MPQVEQVLVARREIFGTGPMFHGLEFNIEPVLAKIFSAGTLRFLPRPDAEKDPSHKQLIPYVIISCRGKYLTYVRGKRAGETRLVGNRSLGIGGHINPIDDMPLLGDAFETYKTAVEREIAEEITILTPHTDRIVALLNDDSNEVGRVHIGVVHHWRLDEPAVERREQMMTQLTFMSKDELLAERDSMETWSQLCLDGLDAITAK